ncbi:MAG: PAS domain S-box protein [Magnetococcales bacterium]|nr:PAS domain S-box protein [Magnetococcales bacterium]
MIRLLRRLPTTSIRRQLVLGIALVHAVLMTVFVFDLVERQQTFLRLHGEKQAMSLSQTLASSSVSWVLANDVVGLEEILRSMVNDPELRYAMVLSPQGKVLGHNQHALTGKFVVDDISLSLLRGPTQPTVLVSDHHLIDVAAPIVLKDRTVAWARVGLGQDESLKNLALVTRKGMIYTVIAILIGTVFALLMARRLTGRLYQLLNIADATRQGRRDLRAPDDRTDELGYLARGFNRMLDALSAKENTLIQMHQRLEEARLQADETSHRLRISYDILQRERNKLHTVLSSIREGIVVTDAHGAVIMVNPALEFLLRKNRDQIEREGILNLVDNPDIVRRCLEKPDENNPCIVHYKGRELLFHASTFREDDRIIGSAALVRDVTEENRLKLQLHEIIGKAPFGIVVSDNQGIIRVFNPESCRLFGYASEEIVGQPVTILINHAYHKRHAPKFIHDLHSDLLAVDRADSFESEAVHKDGSTFPVRVAVNEMMLEDRHGAVSTFADLTEEKRLIENLIQSEKMAGLGTLVRGVAHEINTPVGICVTSSSELADRIHTFETTLDSEGISEEELRLHLTSSKRLIRLMQENLERTAELVRSFKAVAVDPSNETKRAFRMREVMESAVLSLYHEFKDTKLVIEVHCEDTLEIDSFPGVFSQIILHLLKNSLLHGFAPEDHGRVYIECAMIDETQLSLIYKDDGHGMTEEVRRRVFEPFFTTRRNHGGSGLGMHIVFNLVVQILRGWISCQSALGKGTRFQIIIPLEPEGN